MTDVTARSTVFASENDIAEITREGRIGSEDTMSNWIKQQNPRNGLRLEADFKVTVPLSVNVTEIMEETGALNLLRNPTQPSEGVQAQGIGDTDWRHKSFSQLTGIRLTAAKL